MEMGSGSVGSSGASDGGDPLHGLKFGKKIYFGELGGGSGAGGSSSRAPASPSAPALAAPQAPSVEAAAPTPAPAAPRRGKGAVQGGQPQPPRCQVEGCREDLTGSKAYYCRHKVCGMHSKSPKVVVAGLEQRFCQQCSRFHQLHEFDQGKRSCRRRLAGHNERRRKPAPGALKSRYGLLSSFHEDSGRFGSFLMDFSYPRLPATARDVWPTVRIGDRGSTSQWQAGLDTTPSSGVMSSATHTYMQGSSGGSLLLSQEMPPGEGLGVSDSGCALSLLSTQPWGATSTTRIRPPVSDNNYGGPPMGQPGAAASFSSNAWSFKGHEPGSSTHEIPREAGLGQAGGPGDGQFSGELELALQGDKQCIDPGHGRVYCPSGNLMHWSL